MFQIQFNEQSQFIKDELNIKLAKMGILGPDSNHNLNLIALVLEYLLPILISTNRQERY